MKNYIKEHFEERLIERTNYNLETLSRELKKYNESILRLSKNSIELDWFPQLKREFKKYPDSTLVVCEPMGVCIVTSGKNVITIYNL